MTMLIIVVATVGLLLTISAAHMTSDPALKSPKVVDICHKYSKKLAIALIPLSIIYYTINGIQWGALPMVVYLTIMITHIGMQSSEERAPIEKNPRKRVLSKSSENRLYFAFFSLFIWTGLAIANLTT